MTDYIDGNTKVKAGVAAACVVAGISCTLWLTASISKVAEEARNFAVAANSRMQSIEAEIDKVKNSIETSTKDRWTATQEENTALRLALENPMLSVPDPRRPGYFLTNKPRTQP